VADLESLEAVATLGFLPDNVQNGVDELGALGVVTLGPVVASPRLSEDKVVWAEELTEGTGSDRVHGAWFKIHEDGARDVPTASGLVEVHVDSLELEVGVPLVRTSRVNAVLVRDDFPELGPDLVTTLSGLDVNDFSHAFYIF